MVYKLAPGLFEAVPDQKNPIFRIVRRRETSGFGCVANRRPTL